MSKLFAAIGCVLLLLAAITSAAFAARVEGRITTNEVLKDLTELNPSTRITLNGGQFSTLVRKNGDFVIDHVPKGSYLLEIESIEYVYPKIRLDIRDKSIRSTYTLTGNDWQTLGYQLAYPLNITARAPAEYFMVRSGCESLLCWISSFTIICTLCLGLVQAHFYPQTRGFQRRHSLY
ncbi:hypothetical protein BC937DRAFT_89219 [Endogone sp. FLAS-F59071]|nr:hypothetical protein BC937DRAFT_89219 [Endogone sp. FLAS-F59071]|eukprot:RUS18017.1 hypothetical protein BC937DRAFT_89219 [Endogone sp. FLAS-F59071]